MDVVDEIGSTPFNVQHLTRRAVELDAPVMLDEDELDHTFVGPDVDPVQLRRKVGGDGLAHYGKRLLVEHVDGQPIFQVGGRALVCLCQNDAPAIFLPSKQQTRTRYPGGEQSISRPS